MLDQSIERVETTLKYNRFTLIALGPGDPRRHPVRGSADSRPASGARLDVRSSRRSGVAARRWAGVVAIAGVAVFLLLAIRRGRRELERLAAMREAYRRSANRAT